jgi:hypothetical protein
MFRTKLEQLLIKKKEIFIVWNLICFGHLILFRISSFEFRIYLIVYLYSCKDIIIVSITA